MWINILFPMSIRIRRLSKEMSQNLETLSPQANNPIIPLQSYAQKPLHPLPSTSCKLEYTSLYPSLPSSLPHPSSLLLFTYSDHQILSSLSFTCLFCHSLLSLSSLSPHFTSSCPIFVYRQCPSPGCSFLLPLHSLPDHLSECPFALQACKSCHNQVARRSLSSHSCLEVTRTLFSAAKAKSAVLKEKIRYKENERRLLEQMYASLVRELRIHTENIRGYVEKLDRIKEIRMTERGRAKGKWMVWRMRVGYGKWEGWAKVIWNKWKVIWSRCVWTGDGGKEMMWCNWVKKWDKWFLDVCKECRWFWLQRDY